jgi:hypothetical protein
MMVSDGFLVVTDSTISGNTALLGGGLFVAKGCGGGRLVISVGDQENCGTPTLQNAELRFGAAGSSAVADQFVTIIESTINGNIAASDMFGNGGLGAGISVGRGGIAIFNSTISGNVADAGSVSGSAGGGIENAAGRVALNNVTIADNSASTGGGVNAGSGKSFEATNSIISNNLGTASGDDCEGKIHSKGFNLILDTTGCIFTGKTTTDIFGVDPLLQPLALNAPGTTETQVLTTGSPALTKGNPATPNGKGIHCFATGQNGITRPTGACDIGAFQLSL